MENAANKKAAESFDGTSDSAAFAFTANSNLRWNWKFNFLSGTERLGARRLSPPFRLRRNRPGRLPAPQGPLFGCSLNGKNATPSADSASRSRDNIFYCWKHAVNRSASIWRRLWPAPPSGSTVRRRCRQCPARRCPSSSVIPSARSLPCGRPHR